MFPLREIHQIEMTSHCNLRCRYCTSPNLKRPKLHMDETTFRNSLRWVAEFRRRGTQGELNLAGIGESTMHPDFTRFVHLAREAVGEDGGLVLATNGVLMRDEIAVELAKARVRTYVSLHRPEKAGIAVDILKRHGVLAGVSADPSIAPTTWAGQVKWVKSEATKRPCTWVRGGKAFVLADGRISRCAYDASGVGVFGHVNDEVPKLQTSPYVLCRTCEQDVGVPIPEEEVA